MLNTNNTPSILDLELVLNFYNKANKLVGDSKRYKMNDEFFTRVLEQTWRINNEGIEISAFTYAEA